MKKISLGIAFRAFISTVIFTLIYMTVNSLLVANFYGEPLGIYAVSAVIFYGAEFAFSKILAHSTCVEVLITPSCKPAAAVTILKMEPGVSREPMA